MPHAVSIYNNFMVALITQHAQSRTTLEYLKLSYNNISGNRKIYL